ncbi:Loganic acid O-methyltransferase [Sesamum angolense]|uniref:Loganic acid O-methyltransferase n=1 Tax=Sesamum angolense TaxID=2727404 RepID=A0AAE2C5R4_9LAMI|nr:Loganic acid O-methyltransferase [Sesamum angolense]
MTCKNGNADTAANEAFPRRTDLPLYPMNPGDGPHSYVQNSSYQGGVVDIAKPIIEDEIARKLDIKNLSSTSPNCFWVADFGCSTGHNSFPAMQFVTQAIYQKHASSGLITPKVPELFVVFNDVLTNDFNTLFSSLPLYRNYNAIGVPGDFHCRLLPESSTLLTLLGHSTGLRGCQRRWRKVSSGDGEWRANGPSNSCSSCLLEPETEYTLPSDVSLLGSCLMDMAKKGRFSEAKVDSFNLPFYFTTRKELKAILERSHSFSLERLEILNNPGKHTLPTVEARAACFRAVHEGLLTNHFGSEIIDELFHMYAEKLAASPVFSNPNNDKSIVILAVLKRSH